jgi:Malate/L-lactate dehydrogenase
MIVADQSMSAVTKTEMVMRRDRGEPIPLGWAQDQAGADYRCGRGVRGSLLPSGGQKGANIALLIEILAAALNRLATQRRYEHVQRQQRRAAGRRPVHARHRSSIFRRRGLRRELGAAGGGLRRGEGATTGQQGRRSGELARDNGRCRRPSLAVEPEPRGIELLSAVSALGVHRVALGWRLCELEFRTEVGASKSMCLLS